MLGILLDLLIGAAVVAALGFAFTYFCVLYARNSPKLDAEAKRNEYIEKRIWEAGYSPDDRHSAWLWRKYSNEYDKIERAASQH